MDADSKKKSGQGGPPKDKFLIMRIEEEPGGLNPNEHPKVPARSKPGFGQTATNKDLPAQLKAPKPGPARLDFPLFPAPT